jgi:alpha-tubulin suppressor-like RCC1 family protein
MLRTHRHPLTLLALLVASLIGLVAPVAPVSADTGDAGGDFRPAATTLSVGNVHACYVSGGKVFCWGSNNEGQIGQHPTDVLRSSVPLEISGLTGVTAVAAGARHTCVLKSDTTVHCFGASGQAIGNLSSGITYQPIQVLTGAASITAGGGHSCAVMTTGAVRCWGSGFSGELGDGTGSSSHIPVEALAASEQAVAVSAGNSHTCALLSDGTVKCWGFNMEGSLGDGSTTNRNSPVTVGLATGGNLTDAVSVSAGLRHSCAVTTSNVAYCWGGNMYQELGSATAMGGSNTRAHPVRSVRASNTPISDAVGVSAGDYYSCILRTTGAVACFGDNTYGQIGNGTGGSSANQGPETVAGVTGAQAVTTGKEATCAMSTSTLWCWGNSSNGKLGNGSTANVTVADATVASAFLPQTVTFGSLSDVAISSVSRTVSATSSSGAAVAFSSTTTSVCTVSGSTVTYVSPGTCTVKASRAVSGMFLAAADVSRSFSISGNKPTARTAAATSVSASRATLNAVVNPSGLATTVKFVYGLKSDLSDGNDQASRVDTSMNDTDISVTVTGLAEKTTYYYRVEATNEQGTSKGDIMSFTSARPVGVTVNDAAEFTNKRSVTVSVTGPTGSAQAILSNDGGFSNSKTFTLTEAAADIPWTLVASKDERLPKVVYVKFVSRLGSASTPYQDDIILDTTAPAMTGATGAATSSSSGAVTVASRRGGVRLTVRASDKNSGIGKVQVKSSASGRISDVATGSPKATSRTVRVNTTKKRLWVRVVDRAGNASRWVTVTVK